MRTCNTEKLLELGFVLILFIVVGGSIIIYKSSRSPDTVNAFILAGTFIAIMINSFATWILKRLNSKQISMSVKPVLMCRIADGNCQIRNIGNGAALYVQSKERSFLMDETRRQEAGIKRNDIKYVKLGITPCLEKDSEWHGLSVRMMDENKKEQGIGSYDQQLILNQFDDFIIEYRDIDGALYKTYLKRVGSVFETDHFQ